MSDAVLLFAVTMLIGQFSPGPDMLLVTKNALNHALPSALLTVAGIATGIVVHTTVAILGVSVLLQSSPVAWRVLLYGGAAYLAWLGVQLLRSVFAPPESADPFTVQPSARGAYLQGLLTNLLNPKVAVFFSGMLSQFLTTESTTTDRLVFAGIIIGQGAFFWALYAVLLQTSAIKARFLRWQRPINFVFGILLLFIAISTVIRSLVT